jgi:hypothetical protein
VVCSSSSRLSEGADFELMTLILERSRILG